jgi:hypothetical protein
VRRVGHAEAGPQHGHDQRRRGQPVAGRAGDRGLDGLLGDGQVAGGLVDQHLGELPQRRPEGGVVGALVPHAGQAGTGERVVDDGQLHARHRIGTPTSPTGALRVR